MTTLDTYVHRKLTDKKNPKKTNSWATYKKKYGTSQVYVTKNCELCISLITWQLMEKNLADHTEHFFYF